MNHNQFRRWIILLMTLLLVPLAGCAMLPPAPPTPLPRPTPTLRRYEYGWPAPTATSGSPATPTRVVPTATPEPADPLLLRQGFGQDGRELGYSFLVQNPNHHLAYDNSQYQMAAYDANGVVVKTESGYIELLSPGQTLGVSGRQYVDENVVVARVEVTLLPGQMRVADGGTNLTAGKAAFFAGKTHSRATGIVTNANSRDVTNVLVSAVPYNGQGEIVGGGFTFVDFVLAQSHSGVSVLVTHAGDVASVELYPALSGLSSYVDGRSRPAGASEVVLQQYGFGQAGTRVSFGLVLQNRNRDLAVEGSRYQVTAYDGDDLVLQVDEGLVGVLLPGRTLGVGGNLYLPEGSVAKRIEVQFHGGDYQQWTAWGELSTERATYLGGGHSARVTGLVVSTLGKNLKSVRVAAITYDASGAINGGGFTYLDFVPAGGKAAVEVPVTATGAAARAELYASVTDLGEMK